MTTLKDLEAKIASQNENIATLQKAYDDLKKDARMMVTGDSPQSMQIAYSPNLKSKVFEKAAFFRFLESKGRVDDNFGSTYAGFYKETDASLASWIDENDEIFSKLKVWCKDKNGKDIITFDSNPKKYSYLFLIISHNSKASTDKLTNYAFKYTSSSSKDGFINYEIGENQGFLLDKKEDGNNYVYNFNITQFPYNDVNVTYFIRFTPKDDYLENEKDKSIALKETNSFVAELTDYEIKDNRIIKEYRVEEIDYRYVQVIAMVYHSGNYEIVGYGSIFVTESNWWKILLIVVAACIVVIVLIYFLRLYYKRKRDIGRNMAGLDGPMVSRFTQASIA